MQMRIATAAVGLVIGTAAWALAQREEIPGPAGGTPSVQRYFPAPELPPPADGAELSPPPDGPAITRSRRVPRFVRDSSPPPPPTGPPTHPDPEATAATLLENAKAEIARLEGEKQSAEKELAAAKAKIRAAEGGIAKWRALIGPYFDGPPRVEHFADVT